MEIKIEKGIPAPSRAKYPFGLMDVGDSFALPLSGDRRKVGEPANYQDAVSINLCQAAYNYQRRHGLKFRVKTDASSGIVRCWRIA